MSISETIASRDFENILDDYKLKNNNNFYIILKGFVIKWKEQLLSRSLHLPTVLRDARLQLQDGQEPSAQATPSASSS